MSVQNENQKHPNASKQEPNRRAKHDAIVTSMQPFHFVADVLGSTTNYNEKTLDFASKRLDSNLKSAVAFSKCTDVKDVIKESQLWWERVGADYMAHFGDILEYSHELRTEVEDLVDTETEIASAKSEDMFENTPV
ncbi:MAG: hypothetical protein WBC71_08275 [Salaquimonas sp.]